MRRGNSAWLRGLADGIHHPAMANNSLAVELHRTDPNDGDVLVCTARSVGTVADQAEIVIGRGAAGITLADTQLPRQNMRLFCDHDASVPEGLVWRVQSCPKGRASEVCRGRQVLPIPSEPDSIRVLDNDILHQRRGDGSREAHPTKVSITFSGELLFDSPDAEKTGAGVDTEQIVPSPHGSDDESVDGTAQVAAKTAGRILGACAAVGALMLGGAAVLTMFELEAEDEAVADAVAEMMRFKDKYNVSDEDFGQLCDTAGTPIVQSEDGSWVASTHRNWSYGSGVILFAWTILSTIGYGNFAPATVGGKIFLMAWGLVGIPVVLFVTGYLSGLLMKAIEYMMVKRMPELGTAFDHYDADGSGELDPSEYMMALDDLEIKVGNHEGCAMTHAELTYTVGSDGSLSKEEFTTLVATLTTRGVDLHVGRTNRVRNRMRCDDLNFCCFESGPFPYPCVQPIMDA
jgi:hypothetical protein